MLGDTKMVRGAGVIHDNTGRAVRSAKGRPSVLWRLGGLAASHVEIGVYSRNEWARGGAEYFIYEHSVGNFYGG